MDRGVEGELCLGVVEGDDPHQPVCLDESVGGEVGRLVRAGSLITKHGSLSHCGPTTLLGPGETETQSATLLQEQNHTEIPRTSALLLCATDFCPPQLYSVIARIFNLLRRFWETFSAENNF